VVIAVQSHCQALCCLNVQLFGTWQSSLSLYGVSCPHKFCAAHPGLNPAKLKLGASPLFSVCATKWTLGNVPKSQTVKFIKNFIHVETFLAVDGGVRPSDPRSHVRVCEARAQEGHPSDHRGCRGSSPFARCAFQSSPECMCLLPVFWGYHVS
jgi:hypothetical protein